MSFGGSFLSAVIDAGAFCAYIDPGTGSIIIQALIGLVLGTLLALKMFWYRIRSGLSRLFGKKDGDG
jgi:hypothetical protein